MLNVEVIKEFISFEKKKEQTKNDMNECIKNVINENKKKKTPDGKTN